MSLVTHNVSNYSSLDPDLKKEVERWLSFPDVYSMGLTSRQHFQLSTEVAREERLIHPDLRFFHHQGLSLFPQLITAEGKDITRDVTVIYSEQKYDRVFKLQYGENELGEVVFNVESRCDHNTVLYVKTIMNMSAVSNSLDRVQGVGTALMILVMRTGKKEQHVGIQLDAVRLSKGFYHKLGYQYDDISDTVEDYMRRRAFFCIAASSGNARNMMVQELHDKTSLMKQSPPGIRKSIKVYQQLVQDKEMEILSWHNLVVGSMKMHFSLASDDTMLAHMIEDLTSPWYASQWQGRERLIQIKAQEILGVNNARFQTDIDQNNVVTKLVTRSDEGETVLAQAVATYHPNRELHTDDPDMQYYKERGEYIAPSYVLFHRVDITMLPHDDTVKARSQQKRAQITQITTQQLWKDVYDQGIVVEGRYFAGGPGKFWRQSVQA